MDVSYSFHISAKSHAVSTIGKLGQVSRHNTRAYSKSSNDDTKIVKMIGSDNILEDVKVVYHEEFDEALQEYNDRVRSDRKIDDYLTHVSNSRSDVAVEIIIQIGDQNFWKDIPQSNKPLMRIFFKEQLQALQEYCPNFRIANAILHLDEKSPHVHVVGVPVADGYKNGMKKQCAKTRVFTKESLSDLQNSMRKEAEDSIRSLFDILSIPISLREKQPGRNKDIPKESLDQYYRVKDLTEKWEQRLFEDKRELAEVIGQVQLNKQELSDLKNAVLSEKERLNVVQDDFRTKSSQIDDLSRQKTSLEHEYNSLKKEYISLSHDKAELQVNYDALKTAFRDLNAKYSKAKDYIAKLLKDIRDIPAFVSQFKSRLSRPTIEVISEFERSRSEYDPAEDPFYKSTPKKKNRSR